MEFRSKILLKVYIRVNNMLHNFETKKAFSADAIPVEETNIFYMRLLNLKERS